MKNTSSWDKVLLSNSCGNVLRELCEDYVIYISPTLPLWTSGWGFTLSIKLKMRDLYSISLAAILLNFLVDVLCKAPFLEKVFFSIFLIRYISRERNVKGGGKRESASKNWNKQWFLVSQIWMLDDAININYVTLWQHRVTEKHCSSWMMR